MIYKNMSVDLIITSMSFEGYGIAKYSDKDIKDFVVFVNGAVKGDSISCKIIKVFSKYCIGIVNNYYIKSDLHNDLPCTTYKHCGGCSFGHVTYQEELNTKFDYINNLFKKIKESYSISIRPIIESSQQWNYRNKIQLPISSNRKCGFFEKHSHNISEIDICKLNNIEFNEIIKKFEQFINKNNISVYNETFNTGILRHLYLRRAHSTGEIMVTIVINNDNLPYIDQFINELKYNKNIKSIYLNINKEKTNVILGKKFVKLYGKETISDYLCGLKFDIHPNSFYQINSLQTEKLYNYISDNSDLSTNDILLDLYCGIGTIGLCMADKVKKVIGIEVIPEAIQNAKNNAFQNNINNADFYACDAKNTLSILNLNKVTPTVIIVDPPRKGLDNDTISILKKLYPKKIIYVSCNPATLIRDINSIMSDCTYKILFIQPFDMFPHTSHVETVVMLSK